MTKIFISNSYKLPMLFSGLHVFKIQKTLHYIITFPGSLEPKKER